MACINARVSQIARMNMGKNNMNIDALRKYVITSVNSLTVAPSAAAVIATASM
jgi:hypothetical protein